MTQVGMTQVGMNQVWMNQVGMNQVGMNQVGMTWGAAGAASLGAVQGTQAPLVSESGPALPTPEPLPVDPLLALVVLQSKSQQLGLASATKDTQNASKLRKLAWKKQKEAMRRARQKRKKSSFWKKAKRICKKVTKYAAVASAVAVAVGTGGAGTPVAVLAIAGASMSAASFAQSEFGVLERCGMDANLANKFEVGLAIGGVVLSGGAGLMGGATNTSYLDEVDKGVSFVRNGATAATGAATIVGGYATKKASDYDAQAIVHDSDGLAAKLEEQAMLRLFMRLVDQIESSEESDQRFMGSLRGAIEAQGAARVAASGRV